MRGRKGLATAGSLVALLVPAAASPAAVTIGSNLNDAGNENHGAYCGTMNTCTGVNLTLPAGSTAVNGLTSPIDGVVVLWRAKSGSSGNTVAFRVLRPGDSTATFTGAGTSSPTTTVSGIVESSTRLPINAGDSIGLDIGSSAVVWNDTGAPAEGAVWGLLNGFPAGLADGTTAMGAALPGRQLLVQAVIEADADCDGFGDETQDASIDPNGCDTTAPDTTITSGPKNVVKTKKKRAKVTFTFASSEPGSFECSLDGAPFTPCTSPSTNKVKAGRRKPKKHSFQVRAVDAAGNADGSPASEDFKAKRKKKR